MNHFRLLGATALAGSLFLPVTALAQTPSSSSPAVSADQAAERAEDAVSADGQERDDGSIVVTGTRIPRPETDGVLPGVSVTAQQIESRGFTNVVEALNDIALVGGGASVFNNNNGTQAATYGTSFVDLLDAGTQRTLTLVNGRRFVSGNAGSLFVYGNETGSQVDVNVLPATLVDRIDVLTVGGAAAYGTDAIAGVINYILKDDYQGVEVRSAMGVTERGDGETYQVSALLGTNFADGRGNVTLSGEYTFSGGLSIADREFRRLLPNSYTNPLNGSVRNTSFNPGALATGTNTPFVSSASDGIASTLFGKDIVNNTISYPGTIFNVASTTLYTPYTPITSGSGASLVTTNFITFTNGLSPVGATVQGTTPSGSVASIATRNNGYVVPTSQLILGTPGASYITGNGLNGRTTQATNVPFTTFAPTSLPSNVTAASVFAAYGVTAPAGSTAAQQSTLAAGILAANRFTAREFLAANPTVNPNYFIGTFSPFVPRVANTDTTLVSVKVNGGTTQVPVNQVLPFVAVPLEFTANGNIRQYTATGALSSTSPLTLSAAQGSTGGNRNAISYSYLRPQSERYVTNLIGHFDINDEITFFTENTYAKSRSSILRSSASTNSVTNGAENAALLLNYNNPYLDQADRQALDAVGISPTAANGGNFIVTRYNQDIFGDNRQSNQSETFRVVGGLRSKFEVLGRQWNAEVSATYGRVTGITRTTNINDIEYQLALDSVLDPTTNTIRCRSQLFPSQYLGRTPIGVQRNITRLPGADGVPTEQFVTPTITQAMIDSCQPLNPFGYDQMSAESKRYVRQDVEFRNRGEQTFLQAIFSGTLVDLPAGPLGISGAAEYRKDQFSFQTGLLNRLGRSRTAPSANSSAFTETYEVGGEARIPITGPDFLGFVGALEFSPAIRVTQQSGRAATYRNLAGALVTPKSDGDPATIYSLAGTWRPIRDIQFRGNYTRSVRQPSMVELFLGGQPVFTTPTDFCSQANIDSGSSTAAKANRRNNCTAAVISSGVIGANGQPITTADDAKTFLSTYVPAGISLPGSYSGTTDLTPERGESWTVGGVLTPRFLPGFTLSVDYIDLTIRDVITPTGLGQAIQACYDSPTYPNTTAQVGTNLCPSFSRGTDFQVQPGYSLGFLNLGATKIHALNISGSYPLSLGNKGTLTLRGNAYHLLTYKDSSAGDFSDSVETAGSYTIATGINRPKWRLTSTARYEYDSVFAQVAFQWQNATRLFISGAPGTSEVYVDNAIPAVGRFDLTLGGDVNDRFRMQLTVTNLTDKIVPGNFDGNGFLSGNYIDQAGRRFLIQAKAQF